MPRCFKENGNDQKYGYTKILLAKVFQYVLNIVAAILILQKNAFVSLTVEILFYYLNNVCNKHKLKIKKKIRIVSKFSQ